MGWLHPDLFEPLSKRCRSRIKLYGGTAKQQRRNFLPVPLGSVGLVRQRITVGDTGTEYFLCVFWIDGRRLWVRCAVDTVELIPHPRELQR